MKRCTFIFLLFLPSCVLSQVTLDQPPSAVLKPSQTLILTCKVSGISIDDSSYVWNWVRQRPGQGLEWLARIYYDGRTWYAPSLQSRLKITKDTSSPKNEYSLQMTDMRTEDTATYYCARDRLQLREGFDYWGPGTALTVTAVDKTPPSVFPLIPCRDTPSSTTEMTIGCLIRDFLPQPVDIQWNSGSVRDNIKNFPATLGRQSGLYTRSSQLNVKTSEWESQAYECNVEHKPTNTKITKRIVQLPEHTTPKEPTVKVLQSSCDDRSHELVCMISQFSPETITVQWLLNGQVKALSPITSPPAKGSDGTFTSHSQVNIPKEQMNYKDTYTCQVHHPATKTSPKDSIQTCCSECGTSPQPTVTIIPPSVKDLYVTKQPKITCLVTQMLSTKNLEITWSHKRGESSDITITDPDYQIDGTISISSTLNVSPEEWETGDKMSCTVTHADLPSPIVKSISKGPDEGSAPIVYTFPPSQQELSLYETVTLTCLAMQFSPSPIFIRWKRRGRVLSEDAYVSTEPTKEKDRNEFFLYSKLTVQKSDWNNRDVFTCVVFHSALHSKSTEQNIQKPSGSCSCKGNRRRQLA